VRSPSRNEAREEYQADLFFFDDLKEREEAASSSSGRPKKNEEEFNAGLLVADSFSKRLVVEPLRDKTIASLQAALTKAFEELGGKPKMLYANAETALRSRSGSPRSASPTTSPSATPPWRSGRLATSTTKSSAT
jgi:hypothetical protein